MFTATVDDRDFCRFAADSVDRAADFAVALDVSEPRRTRSARANSARLEAPASRRLPTPAPVGGDSELRRQEGHRQTEVAPVAEALHMGLSGPSQRDAGDRSGPSRPVAPDAVVHTVNLMSSGPAARRSRRSVSWPEFRRPTWMTDAGLPGRGLEPPQPCGH